jgi:transposase-like protein
MELASKLRLPRLVKKRIICEYLSGSKTVQMLSEEYGMSRNAVNQLVSRHRSKFSPTFEAKVSSNSKCS